MTVLEDRLASRFFELSSDMLCIADARGYLQRVNPSFSAVLGYDADELTGRPFLAFVHRDDRDATRRAVEALQEGKAVREFTNRCRRKDGAWRWIEWRAAPQENAEGLLYAVARDVTEKRKTVEALRKREAWMRLLFEITAHPSRDVDQQLQSALRLTTELLGQEVGIISRVRGDEYLVEYCHAPGTTVTPGATFVVGDTYCSISLTRGECVAMDCVRESEHRGHPCYKKLRLESYLGTAIRVHGEVYGTISLSAARPRATPFEDIDCDFLELLAVWVGSALERKSAERKLRDGRDRVELALRGADLGLWDWNVQTGEIVINERWAEMLGYSVEEIEPHVSSWEKLVHPEDMPHIEKALQAHLDGETELYETEHRMRAKNGEWIWVLDRGRVFERDADGKPVRAAGTHLDVTEQKRSLDLLAERGAALSKANRELQRRNDEIRRMYHTLCHELKTPLTSVREFVSIVRDGLAGDVTTEQAEHLDTALEGCDELTHHVNDLIDVTRLETGKLSCEKKPTDLVRLLEKIVATKNRDAAEHGITLTLELAEEDLPLADIDSQRIHQVCVNLVNNSLKFTPSRGTVTISVARAAEDSFLSVSVHDTGRGIEADKKSRIFERLYQVKETDWSTAGGMGLGLHLCREIVRLHGGAICVDSEVGKGSVFAFTVPIAGETPRHRPGPATPR